MGARLSARRLRHVCALVCLGLAAASAGTSVAQELSADDEAAVRQVEQDYVRGWLTNQPDSVLATLSPDAVILPSDSSTPLEGLEAIRNFWWGPDNPAASVTSFNVDVDEVGGCGDLAFLRGEFTIEWTQTGEGETTPRTTSGSFVTLFRREPSAAWRIWRQIWNDNDADDEEE